MKTLNSMTSRDTTQDQLMVFGTLLNSIAVSLEKKQQDDISFNNSQGDSITIKIEKSSSELEENTYDWESGDIIHSIYNQNRTNLEGYSIKAIIELNEETQHTIYFHSYKEPSKERETELILHHEKEDHNSYTIENSYELNTHILPLESESKEIEKVLLFIAQKIISTEEIRDIVTQMGSINKPGEKTNKKYIEKNEKLVKAEIIKLFGGKAKLPKHSNFSFDYLY